VCVRAREFYSEDSAPCYVLLQVLVLDEADLLLSYGYAEDLQVSINTSRCYDSVRSVAGAIG
jgi:hypothetical protein